MQNSTSNSTATRSATPWLITVGFVTALLVLGINALIPYYSVGRFVESDQRADHTLHVLDATNQLRLALTDAQAGQRGYLLSADPEFLTPYHQALATIDSRLNRLASLIENNVEQQRRFERLLPLVEREMDLLQQSIDTHDQQGLEAALALVRTREADQVMNSIRELLDDLAFTQNTLLAEHILDSEQSARFALAGFIGITLFNIMVFALLYHFIVRDFRRRRLVEQELRHQTEVKQSILDGMHEGVVVTDNRGELIMFNRSAEDILGRELLRDRAHWRERKGFLNPENKLPLPPEELPVNRVLSGDLPETIEVMVPTSSSGEGRIIAINARPIHGEGELQGVVSVFSDVTESRTAAREIRVANQQLTEGLAALSDRNREVSILSEMSEFFQSCTSQEELCTALARYASRLFPSFTGSLFINRSSKDYLELVSHWGRELQQSPLFAPNQCWAIRLGKLHCVKDLNEDMVCEHIATQSDEQVAPYICAPIIAQGEILGVLTLEGDSSVNQIATLLEQSRQVTTALCEQAGLALANLRLRETLRRQSIQDALTGLYNRRFLEESMGRELSRAERKKMALTVLMFDVDHFKKFNDNFGHDAGDVVLQEMGHAVHKLLREGDIACRYGGEEFCLLLPDADREAALHCAERLLTMARGLTLSHRGQTLAQVTISIGLATYPEDGHSADELLKTADLCLYRSKEAGRDRITTTLATTDGDSSFSTVGTG